MRTGNSEGLGDPGVKDVLLKLAHPRRDTSGTSRKGAGPLPLCHLQVIIDLHDGGTKKIVMIAFGLKDPPHLGELRAQPGRNFLDLQPSGHRVSKICPEGPGLPTRLIALSDGPVVLLTGHATL